MTVHAVVDRIEADLAVLEIDGRQFDWPLSALPSPVVEGAAFTFQILPTTTDSAEAHARLARLRARGPAGDDIDL